MVEAPPGPVAAREGLLEQLTGLLDAQEVLLVGCLLVGVGGRDHHLVDLQVVVEVVEDLDDGLGRVGVEEGGVRGDPEAALLGLLDRRHRLVEHPFLGHRFIVPLAQAVDVDGEREVGRGRELLQLLAHQHRVGAEEDVLLLRHQLADDLVDLRVHQRLAAGDGDHRGARFEHGADGLGHRHALLEDSGRVLDLPAALAGEVAGEQRLQLDNQRELFPLSELLFNEVRRNLDGLTERHGHLAHLLGSSKDRCHS